jgi:hypothetical protein
MGIFDLLGAAGAGYTGGLVQGEQAKIKLLQQTKNNDFKQQQLDQVKLGNSLKSKDLEQQAQDPVRKAWLQYAHDLAAPIATPEGLAEADRNGHLGIRLQAIEHAYGQSMNPTNGDAPPSFNFAQNFAGQGEDAEGNLIDRVARPVQPTMKQEAEAKRADTAAKSAESLAELRKIQGTSLATLTPAKAELIGRQTDLIGHQGPLMDAQAAAARAQAAATPIRVQTEQDKAAADKDYKQALIKVQQTANDIKAYDAHTGRLNAETNQANVASLKRLRAQQIDKLKADIVAAQHDPTRKEYIAMLADKAYTKDDFGDIVANEGLINQLEVETKLPKGTLPRDPHVENPNAVAAPKSQGATTTTRIRINTAPENLQKALLVDPDKEFIKAVGRSLEDGTYDAKFKQLKPGDRAKVQKIRAILEVK